MFAMPAIVIKMVAWQSDTRNERHPGGEIDEHSPCPVLVIAFFPKVGHRDSGRKQYIHILSMKPLDSRTFST